MLSLKGVACAHEFSLDLFGRHACRPRGADRRVKPEVDDGDPPTRPQRGAQPREIALAVFDVVKEVATGRWKGGVRELGLAEGGVGYVLDERNRKWISPAVEARVEALRGQIIRGEIQVPSR